MSRRLILLGLPWHRTQDPRVPLGHGSLLAAAREAGVDIVARTFSLNVDSFDVQQVMEFVLDAARGVGPSADLAVGAYIWNEHVLRVLLLELRRSGFEGRIVLGGPQVSYAGPGLETLYPTADVFVRGYGESALSRLSRSRLPLPIAGVHYAGNLDAQLQAKVDLQGLPSPLLTGAVPVAHGDSLVRLETQRGCPFRCNFCQHREAGSRLARRSLDSTRVLQEIDLVCARSVREVAILDPVFNMGTEYHAVLEQFIRGGFRGKLSVQGRLETVDELFVEQCRLLRVLPEFGLQSIHRAEQIAVQRPNAMARVGVALERLVRASQAFMVTIIYGLPEQTVDSLRATIDYLLRARVPIVRAFPLVLLRGTELERRAGDWALEEDSSQIPQVVASSTFDRRDHHRMAELAGALRQTEGRHPSGLAGLDALIASMRRSAV